MEKDGEEYLSEFHLWERLLMIAQRQGHRTEEELGSVIKRGPQSVHEAFHAAGAYGPAAVAVR